ncbi:MAG: site-specific integrase, partial [Clostridia bacterium]|nr:site-specific integrase [Clostridia bacterium]
CALPIYGKSYNKKYLEYVFVDDIGDIIKPDYVSNKFRDLLRANNLKHIRFHDLRHSCASLLVASGVPMKNIQEWLGHSNFSTTADIYSHLDFSAKIESANIISSMLSKKDENQVIDDEIKELERLLEEKRKKRKQDESEM